ncbi:MAG: hypothetical protein WCD89_11105 [Anaerocolumna sp.]
MKTIIKYIAMIMFTVGLSYLCFILPPELSSLQDAKALGHINLETLEETKVELHQQMSMLEKMNLLSGQDENADGIVIKQGKELTEEDAKEACKDETDKFIELGILDNIDVDFNKDFVQARINFYISTADPSKSMIVWNLIFIHDNNSIIISLDDETGKIIGFVTTEYSNIYPNGGGYEGLIKKLADYYGLELKSYKPTAIDGKYEPSLYYKNTSISAIFSDGEKQLLSNVFLFKTGFSVGIYDYLLYEIAMTTQKAF